MNSNETNVLNVIATTIPHVFRIDIDSDGTAHECAVLKKDPFGNLFYIKISDLDMIDRIRIGKILHNRFIRQLPLWDVMSQTTLKNGVNALTYFHQLVKGITPEGKVFIPRAGQHGYSASQVMHNQQAAQKARDTHNAEKAAAEKAAQ